MSPRTHPAPRLRRTRAVTAAFGALALVGATGGAVTITEATAPLTAQAAGGLRGETVPAETYVGKVEVVRDVGARRAAADTITGTVFEDVDQDSSLGQRDKGVGGVVVSNGREVTTTDPDGRYTLPAYDNMTVTVSQPSGYQVPVDEHRIAQFGYHHLPNGSPKLRFGGIAPTGPVPSAVNFPLMKSKASAAKEQGCVMAGDLQTYSGREIGYATIGALKDIADRGELSACGVLFLGDVAGDDLGLYPQMKQAIGMINGPVRFLPGNHDLDFDATDPDHSMDTFRAQMGPDYFSYNVGDTHVIALNDVRYPCTDAVDSPAGRLGTQCSDPEKTPRYNGRLDDNQLAWLKADIDATPKDKLIVIASHIPFLTYADMDSPVHQLDQVKEVYAMLEGRRVVHTSGHTHSIENLKAGDSYGPWRKVMGVEKLPFPHIVAGAISGDWYSGDLNEDGVPMAFQRDGGRPGVLTLDISGNTFKERFTVRGAKEGEKQLNVGMSTPTFRSWFTTLDTWRKANPNNNSGAVPPLNYNDLGDPNMVTTAELAEGSWLTTNFLMGATDSTVRVRLAGKTLQAQRTQPARGEGTLSGADYADPVSAIRQLSVGRTAQQSSSGDDEAQGYRLYRGSQYGPGAARPGNNLADRMHHLWRLDLPQDLGEGVHRAQVIATDSYGREFTQSYAFTVVKERPRMEFRTELFAAN